MVGMLLSALLSLSQIDSAESICMQDNVACAIQAQSCSIYAARSGIYQRAILDCTGSTVMVFETHKKMETIDIPGTRMVLVFGQSLPKISMAGKERMGTIYASWSASPNNLLEDAGVKNDVEFLKLARTKICTIEKTKDCCRTLAVFLQGGRVGVMDGKYWFNNDQLIN